MPTRAQNNRMNENLMRAKETREFEAGREYGRREMALELAEHFSQEEDSEIDNMNIQAADAFARAVSECRRRAGET